MHRLCSRYIILLFVVCGMLCSCTTVSKTGELYQERITNSRSQTIRGQKKLRLAVYGNNAKEIETVQAQLSVSGITAEILYADSKASLFPLLRSGRADIAAAMLSEMEITDKHLTALPFYKEKKKNYFLAFRRGDSDTASFFQMPQEQGSVKNVHKDQKHNQKK